MALQVEVEVEAAVNRVASLWIRPGPDLLYAFAEHLGVAFDM